MAIEVTDRLDCSPDDHPGPHVEVVTVSASGARYRYRFVPEPVDDPDAPLALAEKLKTTADDPGHRDWARVAPTVTPAVREALVERGFDLA